MSSSSKALKTANDYRIVTFNDGKVRRYMVVGKHPAAEAFMERCRTEAAREYGIGKTPVAKELARRQLQNMQRLYDDWKLFWAPAEAHARAEETTITTTTAAPRLEAGVYVVLKDGDPLYGVPPSEPATLQQAATARLAFAMLAPHLRARAVAELCQWLGISRHALLKDWVEDVKIP